MAIGPTLTTARLVLRPPTQDDFPAFAAMMANADHVQFIGGALPESMAWRQLQIVPYAAGDYFMKKKQPKRRSQPNCSFDGLDRMG